jgi:hypothetical protein
MHQIIPAQIILPRTIMHLIILALIILALIILHLAVICPTISALIIIVHLTIPALTRRLQASLREFECRL